MHDFGHFTEPLSPSSSYVRKGIIIGSMSKVLPRFNGMMHGKFLV